LHIQRIISASGQFISIFSVLSSVLEIEKCPKQIPREAATPFSFLCSSRNVLTNSTTAFAASSYRSSALMVSQSLEHTGKIPRMLLAFAVRSFSSLGRGRERNFT
jgi:hypothetical protein